MEYSGLIRKMRTEIKNNLVHYTLPIGNTDLAMNDLIGKTISLTFNGEINCIKCGRHTNKSFAQGFCYPCFTTAPETEECVLKPELCRAHEGVARDMKYAEQHCLSDQFVYLAVSSGLKVGVTRHSQIPTRWIDQGASYALPIARVPNRFTAGRIEVFLKEHFADKTNWQQMLKNNISENIDLISERERASQLLPADLKQYILSDDTVVYLQYPVENYPSKVKAINFDKTTFFSGVLLGIKGQYLIFSDGQVLNIRKFGGYNIRLQVQQSLF